MTWTVTVTNQGGKVEIDRLNASEECIDAWAEGSMEESTDLPVSNSTIDAHETATIYEKTFTATNTGPNDLTLRNEVTVSSNGGDDSDEETYTITTNDKRNLDLGESEIETALIPE